MATASSIEGPPTNSGARPVAAPELSLTTMTMRETF
jgi:hypothetical protein